MGVEFKSEDAPRRTKSMIAAVETLGLKKLFVIYPGAKDYALDEKIDVLSITNLAKLTASPA